MKLGKTFRPEWQFSTDQFSDWHYSVLSGLDNAAAYYYDKPVVVLMNGKSFGATDSLLAGLKDMTNVTLLGSPSGGGIAFTQQIRLRATPLRVNIGSMASFQSDGRLFEGHCVSPDLLLEPSLDHYIGGRDQQLARAVNLIRNFSPFGLAPDASKNERLE